MCGIFGFDRTNEVTRRMFGPLADRMEMRGRDSWGCTDGDFIYKEVGKISNGFVDLEMEGPIFHTRQASVGAVTERNAHPFEAKGPDGTKVIGIHNGHISNWQSLKEKYKRKELEVDSEHIFMHLAEKRSLGDIDGWGAVVWYDISPDGTKRKFASKFGKMDNLHIVRLADDTHVFASTAEAIEAGMRYANINQKYFYEIKENGLYEFTSEGLMNCGELDWGKDVSRVQYSNNRGSSTFQRSFQANICAAPGCVQTVPSDRLICRGCMQEIMVNYGTSWAAV